MKIYYEIYLVLKSASDLNGLYKSMGGFAALSPFPPSFAQLIWYKK
jgi:hypothetical protein